MPRGRRSNSSDAQDILQALIREGRISSSDINRYREIRQLEQRLEALRGGGGRRGRRPGMTTAATATQRAAAGGRRGRRGPITAQQLASRKLQGRYLGLIRQIPASQRARYAKIAKDKGREAAIKDMQSALNK